MEMFLRLREKFVVDAVLGCLSQWHAERFGQLGNAGKNMHLPVTLRDIQQLRDWASELMTIYDNRDYPVWFRDSERKIQNAPKPEQSQ
jgi:hypothetical protein